MGKNDSNPEEGDLSFDLYPERRPASGKRTLWDQMFHPQNDMQKFTCERNVQAAVKKNPVVKILMGALKNAGCPVNLKRHLVCEDCNSLTVQGGYDPEYNQIVICKNISKSRNHPEVVLIHELIHMYDNCVNELDFRNLEHLACTEIRAANLAHCSFLSSFLLRQSSPFNIKETHQYCVKMKAAQSLVSARNINFPTAAKYVLKVFNKCYNDLEPIGRRIKRNSNDGYLAYKDAVHNNICEEEID